MAEPTTLPTFEELKKRLDQWNKDPLMRTDADAREEFFAFLEGAQDLLKVQTKDDVREAIKDKRLREAINNEKIAKQARKVFADLSSTIVPTRRSRAKALEEAAAEQRRLSQSGRASVLSSLGGAGNITSPQTARQVLLGG